MLSMLQCEVKPLSLPKHRPSYKYQLVNVPDKLKQIWNPLIWEASSWICRTPTPVCVCVRTITCSDLLFLRVIILTLKTGWTMRPQIRIDNSMITKLVKSVTLPIAQIRKKEVSKNKLMGTGKWDKAVCGRKGTITVFTFQLCMNPLLE